MKFLVADWGAEKFREVLETEYLQRALLDGPRARAAAPRRDHVGVHQQKDGKFYVGVAPMAGRVVRHARWSTSPSWPSGPGRAGSG